MKKGLHIILVRPVEKSCLVFFILLRLDQTSILLFKDELFYMKLEGFFLKKRECKVSGKKNICVKEKNMCDKDR